MKLRRIVPLDIENKILIPFACISLATVLCFCIILYFTEFQVKVETERQEAQTLIGYLQADLQLEEYRQQPELLLCLSLASQLEKLFQEEEHFILHAGISQISREAEDMPTLYEEAERAVISLYTYERESTYMFYEEEQRTSLLEIFNTETLSRLRNVLLSSQKSTAVAMIEDLFHRAEAFPLEAEERKNEIFYSLYNVYQSVFLALHIDSISIEKPLSSAPVSQMKQIFTDAAFRLCEITESNRKSHNEELRNRILSQIEDNYQDPGLSAYVISRKAGISE